MQKNDALPYCAEIVRDHDPDRFMMSLYAPSEAREALWALFAFNHEISKTRDVVSESTLGLIRLQWWRDAIAAIYERNEILHHEVIKPLAEAIKHYGLPREHFDTLIYAREFDLEDVQPGNVEGLLNYADFTTTPLLKLAAAITGTDPTQEVIQPIGMVYTTIHVLRDTPKYAQKGRLLLPEDLTKAHDITLDTIFEESTRSALKTATKEVVSEIPSQARPDNVILKAHTALAEIYKRQLVSQGYDVLAPRMQLPPAFKALRMFWKIKIL